MARFPLVSRRFSCLYLLALALGTASCGGDSRGAAGNALVGLDPRPGTGEARFALANGCYALQEAASGRYLAASSATATAFTANSATQASGFFLKAAALGQYLFYDREGRYLSYSAAGGTPLAPTPAALNLASKPSDAAIFTVDSVAGGYSLVSTGSTRVAGPMGNVFALVPASDCRPYPEAELNATGSPFKGRLADGTVFGYAETHMHLGGSEALGGKIGYGSPFHKFGVIEAIGNCEVDHGPMGSLAAVDHLLGTGSPVNRHDTVGWPTYKDWPKYSSQGHHQTYYVWVKRAWMGGLRFMVNHLVANEVLCTIWPQKQNDCNEMVNARLQRQLVLDLQDYIDAQEGGPGKGFFRIVYSSAEARRVIESGKLAVVFGIEAEKILDCGEQFDMPECTNVQINQRLDEWHAMGLRFAFPLHIFDNAFGGAEFSRFTKDAALLNLYNAGNIYENGHPYATIPCDQANAVDEGEAETRSYGVFDSIAALALTPMPLPNSGCIENARPLTATGEHFVNRMIDYGMVIETDHAGSLARKRIMDIAKSRNVAFVSGHTGVISVQRDSQRIANFGGILSTLPDKPATATIQFSQDLTKLYPAGTKVVTGLGSDINGIHAQAPPRPDAASNPLVYPFKSYDGQVTFERQRTGQRLFDLNLDGVSHYGLYPDYLADIQRTPGGAETMAALFRSAEAYLQLWERSERARTVVLLP